MKIESLGQYIGSSALYNYRNLFREYVNGRSRDAFATGDAARDALVDVGSFEKRREQLRGKFIELIGGLPPFDTPLNAAVTGIVQDNGFRIEKVIFESRPKNYVTANLYVPDGITAPTGAVLFVCGHFEEAKHAGEYQSVCRQLVRAGLVVLAQDPVGQGERMSYYDAQLKDTTVEWGVAEHTYAGNQCLMLGDCIARYFVHDSMRSIDYLCTRPEVDPARIGVTGNSGGGTQTSLMMVCDGRIAAAAPTTFIMSRLTYMETEAAQDHEQVWPGMSALGFDHEDILLAMAPKPVHVNAVQYDFFPIEGTRRTVERARRIWELYGLGENLELAEDASDHHYTPALAAASARFFARRLLGRDSALQECPADARPPKELHCTRSGQVRAVFPDARAVQEENLGRLEEINRKNGSMPDGERRERALAWLKDKVTGGRDHCQANPKFIEGGVLNGLMMQSCVWRTQKGLLNHGLLLRDVAFAGRELPATLAVWDGGTGAISGHMKWVYEACAAGRAVIALDVTADGVFTPEDSFGRAAGAPFGPLYKFGCDLLWLGDSIAAIRTWDVVRALEMAQTWPGVAKHRLKLYGRGDCAAYVKQAAFLTGFTGDVDAEAGAPGFAAQAAARHYDDRNALCAFIPGMLQTFDLQDLDRWSE